MTADEAKQALKEGNISQPLREGNFKKGGLSSPPKTPKPPPPLGQRTRRSLDPYNEIIIDGKLYTRYWTDEDEKRKKAMTSEEAKEALKAGKKVRVARWKDGYFIKLGIVSNEEEVYSERIFEIENPDEWEIVE